MPHISGGNSVPLPCDLAAWLVANHSLNGEREAYDLAGMASAILDRLGIDADEPLYRSCEAVANEVTAWKGHAYHSAAHHAEVALNAVLLACVSGSLGRPIRPYDMGLLLLAALGHDLGYQPGRQGSFSQELVAADTVADICEAEGLDAFDRDFVHLLILTTEPSFRRTLKVSKGKSIELELPEGFMDVAQLLSDADLLSSAGLTLDWHRTMTARLEEELGHPLSPAGTRFFFEKIVGWSFISPAGQHFEPNMRKVRSQLNIAIHDAFRPGDREREIVETEAELN